MKWVISNFMFTGGNDLTGCINGKIKIISFRERRNRQIYWNYICQCGKEGKISSAEFKRNRTAIKSCGCVKPKKDLSGSKFSMLTLIRISCKKGSRYYYLCRCDCGNEKEIAEGSLTRNHTKSCGCLSKLKSKNLKSISKERLLSRIKYVGECWEYQGRKDKDGYGILSEKSFGSQRAHRASFIAFKGEIKEGYMICHTCDNPPCINPDHLYQGTAKDNARDMLERGLFPIGENKKKGSAGEKNSHAKLTEKEVKEIRISRNPIPYLSKKYRVSESSIRNIILGKSWTHI